MPILWRSALLCRAFSGLAARLSDLALQLRGQPCTPPIIRLYHAACTAHFITLKLLRQRAIQLSDADWVRLLMAAGGSRRCCWPA